MCAKRAFTWNISLNVSSWRPGKFICKNWRRGRLSPLGIESGSDDEDSMEVECVEEEEGVGVESFSCEEEVEGVRVGCGEVDPDVEGTIWVVVGEKEGIVVIKDEGIEVLEVEGIKVVEAEEVEGIEVKGREEGVVEVEGIEEGVVEVEGIEEGVVEVEGIEEGVVEVEGIEEGVVEMEGIEEGVVEVEGIEEGIVEVEGIEEGVVEVEGIEKGVVEVEGIEEVEGVNCVAVDERDFKKEWVSVDLESSPITQSEEVRERDVTCSTVWKDATGTAGNEAETSISELVAI